MIRWIDRSRSLAKFIQAMSNFLAKRRGLLTILGIMLVIVSFVFQLLGIYSTNKAIELVSVILHNLGVLFALIGLLLIQPLGKM